MTTVNNNNNNSNYQNDVFNTTTTSKMNWIIDEIIHILYTSIGGFRYGIKIRTPHAIIMTLLFKQQLSIYDKLVTIYKLTKEHTVNLTKFATIYKILLLLFKFWSRKFQQLPIIKQQQQQQNRNHHHHLQRRIVRFQDDNTLSNTSNVTSSPSNSTTTLIKSSLVPSSLSSSSSLFGMPDTNNNKNIIGIGYAENSFHAFLAGTISGYIVWGNYTSINYQIVLYLLSRISVALLYRIRLYIEDLYRNKQQQQQQQLGNTTSSTSNSTFIYSTCAALIWGIVMMLYEDTPYVLHPSLKSSMDEIYRFQLLLFPSFSQNKENQIKPKAKSKKQTPIQTKI